VSTARAIARGTSRLLYGLFGAKAFDFALYLVLVRGLSVEQFGRHMYGLSFTMLFAVVADLGVTTHFARELARRPHALPRLLRRTFAAKLLLAAVTFALALLAGLVTAPGLASAGLIAIFTLGLLLISVAVLFECLLRNDGRAGAAGLALVVQSITALSTGVVFLLLGFGIYTGACAYLCGAIVRLIAASGWAAKHWRPLANFRSWPNPFGQHRPQGQELRSTLLLVRDTAPLALSGVFFILYFRADTVMLERLAGPQAVALYGSVFRFFEAMVLVSVAYRSVLFPVMARRADAIESLAALCRKSFRLHLMFTIGVAVVVTILSPNIVALVLGPKYGAAAPVLAAVVWALPAAYMIDTLMHLLAAQRRQLASARAVTIAAFANVLFNALCIPRWGASGAAIALIGGELVCFGILLAEFRRTVPGVGLARALRAPLLAGVAAAFTMSALAPVGPGGVSGMVLSGCVGILVYLLVLSLLGAIEPEDRMMVEEMIPARMRRERNKAA
jgi:O-antigen/teichoic acid export membrane protein